MEATTISQSSETKRFHQAPASQGSIKELISMQREFFKTGKTRDVEFRIDALNKLLKILTNHEKDIIEALHRDLRKPQLEAFSTEIAYVLEDIRYVLKKIRKWAKPQKLGSPIVLMPAKSRIYSEPFGNTLIIAPWNYPFQLAVSPLIGALAAGNTAIVKPSEMTPYTESLLARLIGEAFPREYVACVTGGAEVSQELLDEKFDFIFFTGSTKVGKIVAEKAAKHLTPVCLELGGKSPCIIDKNIDLKTTCRRIAWGKFMNAGQTCVAPDYLLVDRAIYPKFVAELGKTVEEFYGKNIQSSDSYARIVNEGHFNRLTGLMDSKKIAFGGKVDKNDKFIEPTLIKDAEWTDSVMDDEIFGPLLPIIPYDSLGPVLTKIAERPKPLALYVFSKDSSFQEKILTTLSYGGACVNDCIVHLANPDLPFGGVGDSGIGAYHGRHSFDLFSHKKSVLKKPFWGDATMRYAPYTDMKLKLIRFFMG